VTDLLSGLLLRNVQLHNSNVNRPINMELCNIAVREKCL
jgi:hypothetical protein